MRERNRWIKIGTIVIQSIIHLKIHCILPVRTVQMVTCLHYLDSIYDIWPFHSPNNKRNKHNFILYSDVTVIPLLNMYNGRIAYTCIYTHVYMYTCILQCLTYSLVNMSINWTSCSHIICQNSPVVPSNGPWATMYS